MVFIKNKSVVWKVKLVDFRIKFLLNSPSIDSLNVFEKCFTDSMHGSSIIEMYKLFTSNITIMESFLYMFRECILSLTRHRVISPGLLS